VKLRIPKTLVLSTAVATHASQKDLVPPARCLYVAAIDQRLNAHSQSLTRVPGRPRVIGCRVARCAASCVLLPASVPRWLAHRQPRRAPERLRRRLPSRPSVAASRIRGADYQTISAPAETPRHSAEVRSHILQLRQAKSVTASIGSSCASPTVVMPHSASQWRRSQAANARFHCQTALAGQLSSKGRHAL